MAKLERIGVSLDTALLKKFDKLIKDQGYQNRSEAIRDLIRDKLSVEKTKSPNSPAIAAVCLVYDHHKSELMKKLTDLQHSHLLETICSTHIHLDKHDCMELIVLKGKAGQIDKMGQTLVSLKGVKLGKINMITTS